MQKLLSTAMGAGSLGFSTSNSTTHNDHEGEPVPSRFADHDEFVALAGICREFEGSQLQIQPGMTFDEETYRLVTDMSLAAQRTLNWNAMFTGSMDETTRALIDRQLAMSDYARERGANVVGLVVPVTGGVHIDFARGGVFDILPGWDELFQRPVEERIRLLSDTAYRSRLKANLDSPGAAAMVFVHTVKAGERILVEYAESPAAREFLGMSVAEVAGRRGIDPVDALFDLALLDNLNTLFALIPNGEDKGTYGKRVQLWRDDRLCVGGSDAGAHVETIDTFNYFTRMLATPVREHGVLSLEECIHHITLAPARLMGLRDRGELRTGAWADICIFDPDTVGTQPVETRQDFPGGAKRLYAEASGIEQVIVGGTTIVHQGSFTGALAGRFLERGRDTYTVGI